MLLNVLTATVTTDKGLQAWALGPAPNVPYRSQNLEIFER